MTKNLILGPIFVHLVEIWTPFFFFFFQGLPLLVVRHCSKLSLYTISRKTNEPNWENDKKPSFGPNFGQFDPKSGHQIYFQKPGSVIHDIWWSAIIMYNIRKKLMIQSSENLVTDGQTDRPEWFHRTLHD